MKTFDRPQATLLARTAREAIDFRRWLPNLAESTALIDLERSLSISIQAGQPELEAMQARMISDQAAHLHALATAAYRADRIAEATMVDEQVFGSDRNRLLDVIDVRGRTAEVVDVSYLRRSAPAALAA